MKDITTIRLSKKADAVATSLVETGKFENTMSAAKFALSYAIKNYYDTFDPASYKVTDSEGFNYNVNVGSIDKDNQLSQLLRALYPGVETPYIYAKALMEYGLIKIGELIDKEGMPEIYKLC